MLDKSKLASYPFSLLAIGLYFNCRPSILVLMTYNKVSVGLLLKSDNDFLYKQIVA